MSDGMLPLSSDPAMRRQRRALLMADERCTGIDWVEIVDEAADRTRLAIHFVPSNHQAKPAIPRGINPANVVVTRRDRAGEAVYAAAVDRAGAAGTLVVDIPAGLSAIGGDQGSFAFLEIQDIEDIDPLFARVKFPVSRQGRSPTEPGHAFPPPGASPRPSSVDYLAKDYQSFRQLMLDHMATLVPDWRERHPADMSNAVVEILAYAGDYLSYYQDAVATEAYLGTARLRTSVRRHARLLDYRMHEGCSARVWLRVEVSGSCTLRRGLRVVCDDPGALPLDVFASGGQPLPPRDGRAVFETIEEAELRPEHNRLELYAWGIGDFRLRAGTTSAALGGRFPHLAKGDVLVLTAADPPPGSPAIESSRRHAVRLVRDPRHLLDPLTGREIAEIAWADADALPFEIAVWGPATDTGAAAWGNIVAADAGFTVGREVQEAEVLLLQADACGHVIARLRHPDLVRTVPYDPGDERMRPAADFTRIDPHDAVAAVRLEGIAAAPVGEMWLPRPDLLDSDQFADTFVAESDDDGVTTLRFGDDVHGSRPPPDTKLRAVYRTGRGDRNVGAQSIMGWERRPGDECITSVSNPLPAAGGVAREPVQDVQRDAPEAFRILRHCVIPDDYAAALKGDARVQDAVAQTQWTGSGKIFSLHVQPTNGRELDPALRAALTAALAPRSVIGADFAVRAPRYVPLRVALTISIEPFHVVHDVCNEVRAAVVDLFRFDRWMFGQPVYLSPLIARAMDVSGVADVVVDRFERDRMPDAGARKAGRIDLAPPEIARLDNRPDAPHRGTLTVSARLLSAQGTP